MKKFYFIFCSFLLLASGNLTAQETTVHTVTDTAFVNSTAEYEVLMTTVSEVGKTTVTIEIKPLASDLGQIYDVNISRDTDARLSGRGRFMTALKPDAQGRIVAEDAYASWDASNVGTGVFPTGTPLFYSVTINRLAENGGTARGKRSIPGIYLGKDPDVGANETISWDASGVIPAGQLTLNTLAWVNKADSSVVLRFGFAGENDIQTYQQMLLAKVTPLYPAGDSPIYIKNTWFNNSTSATGKTDIAFGNIYWGYEGVTYAKIKVKPEWVDNAGNTYVWFTFGYPAVSTITPLEIAMGYAPNAISKVSVNECKVFPTTTTGLVDIKSKGTIREISIVNLLGEIIYSKSNISADQIKLDLSGKPSGLYHVLVKFDNESFVSKIVKR